MKNIKITYNDVNNISIGFRCEMCASYTTLNAVKINNIFEIQCTNCKRYLKKHEIDKIITDYFLWMFDNIYFQLNQILTKLDKK